MITRYDRFSTYGFIAIQVSLGGLSSATATVEPLKRLSGHTSSVQSVSASPSGTEVLNSSPGTQEAASSIVLNQVLYDGGGPKLTQVVPCVVLTTFVHNLSLVFVLG